MEDSQQAGLDYGSGKIGQIFAKIFFPTLLGLVFNALITIVDGVFVGQGVGPDGIAAVNIIAPMFMIVTGTGLMFGIGASVVAGIAIARNDSERAGTAFTQGTIFATLIVAVLIGVVLLTGDLTPRLLGSSERLMDGAMDYMLWLLPGFLPLMFQCVGMMVIRLDGSPKYAMYCNIIPAVINIGLDYYLVFPCSMGVKGAAIATSASVAIGGAMVLAYFLKWRYVIRFRWQSKGFMKNVWRQMVIGSSAFITEVAMSVMMLTGNYQFMAYHGDAGVAAFSIACYLFPLMFMMSNAVAQSAQPIISFNYGRGASERVAKAFRLSRRVALLCGAIAFLGISFGAKVVVAMFIPIECEAGKLAVSGLPVYAVCSLFFALNIAYIGYFQSIEQSVKAMAVTLLRGVLILVPMFMLLPRLLPGVGLWAAIPASELLTLLLTLLMMHFAASGSSRK